MLSSRKGKMPKQLLVMALTAVAVGVATEEQAPAGVVYRITPSIVEAAQAYDDRLVVGIACFPGLRGCRGKEMTINGFRDLLSDFPLMREIVFCADVTTECYRIQRQKAILVRQQHGFEAFKPPAIGMLQLLDWVYRPVTNGHLIGTNNVDREMAERLKYSYEDMDAWLQPSLGTADPRSEGVA